MEISDNQGVQFDVFLQSYQLEEVFMEIEQFYVNNIEDNKMEVDEYDIGKEKLQVEFVEVGFSSLVSYFSKNRCLLQRVVLIKVVFSFLKKFIFDLFFLESIRNGNVMF